MKVSKERVLFCDHAQLTCLRLLDLNDQLTLLKHLLGTGHYFCPHGGVKFVRVVGPFSGS